jgi:hypothetical protein
VDVDTPAAAAKVQEKKVRHNNNTGRYLTPFRPVWDPKVNDSWIIGNMDKREPRAVDIFSGEAKMIHQVRDVNATTITSVNAFHPTLDVFGGGNSSGKCYLWRLPSCKQ